MQALLVFRDAAALVGNLNTVWQVLGEIRELQEHLGGDQERALVQPWRSSEPRTSTWTN